MEKPQEVVRPSVALQKMSEKINGDGFPTIPMVKIMSNDF